MLLAYPFRQVDHGNLGRRSSSALLVRDVISEALHQVHDILTSGRIDVAQLLGQHVRNVYVIQVELSVCLERE